MTDPTLLPLEDSGTPQTVLAGPGERLRSAREAQRLSIGKVADQLHLDPRLVAALEHNDYEHLPEPIYVTGYLRNYARLLHVPEDEVVSSYRRLDMPPPPILSELTRKPRPSTPLNHMLIQWGAVGLVAIGLVLVSWHMSGRSPAPAPPSAGSTAAKTEAPPGETHGAATAVNTEATGKGAPAVAAVSAARGSGGPLAPAPAAAQAPPTEGPAAAPDGPGSAPAPVVAPPAGGEGPPSAGPVRGAAAGAATVVFRFDHDSWVEVTDATGQRVFFDLGKAGETRTVQGTPPFEVLLGYSPGVSIEYNGKPFDQSSFAGRNNVARFTMGRNDQHPPG